MKRTRSAGTFTYLDPPSIGSFLQRHFPPVTLTFLQASANSDAFISASLLRTALPLTFNLHRHFNNDPRSDWM